MISESYNISEFIEAIKDNALTEISSKAGIESQDVREDSFKDSKADTYYRFLSALKFLCGTASMPASGIGYVNLMKLKPIILKAAEGTEKETDFKKIFGESE